ncbi:MAG: hypothetical protein HDQ99_03120 [Lachnospiraceae bacterium]|nr:hypothetical protein [Lachnospiraceae bacterium]
MVSRKENVEIIEIISTSHTLARELLSKPDGFIIATFGEEEYIISNIQRISTHANIDDSVTYWTLNLRDGGNGNIKR